MHARQLLCDLGHTLYESLCSYVYIRDKNLVNNEYESSIMVIHHSLKRRNLIVLVHTHTSQKLQNISEHSDMRYVLCGRTLKSMLINTMLLFHLQPSSAVWLQQVSWYVVTIILWSSAITTCTNKVLGHFTSQPMQRW